MSKKDRDWTVVNEDGSVQIEQDQVIYAAEQVQNVAKKDSDSEQDFEVVPHWKMNKNIEHNDELYKGIVIKEDHFADDLHEDGSDIEVVKCTVKKPASLAESASQSSPCKKQSQNEFASEKVMWNDSSIAEEIEGSFIALSSKFNDESSSHSEDEKSSLNDIEKILHIDNIGKDQLHLDANQFDLENEFDGLAELFKEVDNDTSSSKAEAEADDDLKNEENGNAGKNDHDIVENSDNGIILSTSVFIIVLCLSVTLGLFLGKGLNHLLTSNQIGSKDSKLFKEVKESALEAKSFESQPQVIVFVDKNIYRLNYTTVWASKNAKHHMFDIRVAYQEMQLKYHKLQRKYQALSQEYHVQKHLRLFSKRMANKQDKVSMKKKKDLEKRYPKLNLSKENGTAYNFQSQDDVIKELRWWKIRTAIWRRKYLNLKVEFLDKERNCSLNNRPNLTLNSCVGMLAKYIPDLNVTSLLKQDTRQKITSSARYCWRKVLGPVQEVSNRMTSGIFKLGQNAWGTFSRSWDTNNIVKKKEERSQSTGKSSIKWQRFRKVFAISNIVGSALWKKDKRERKATASDAEPNPDAMFCHKKPMENEEEFKDRWSHDAKETEKVNYLRPATGKFPKAPNLDDTRKKKGYDDLNRIVSSSGFESKGNDCALPYGYMLSRSDMCLNRRFESKRMLQNRGKNNKRCSRHTASRRQLKQREINLGRHMKKMENDIRTSSNKNHEKRVKLQMEMDDFEMFKQQKKDEIEKKKEILEYHLRKHSNKKRQESKLSRKQIKRLEDVIKKLQFKFEKLLRKLKKVRKEKKSLKKKLKEYSTKHHERQKTLKNTQKKLDTIRKETNRKLKLMEEELKKKLKERKQAFEKWRDQQNNKFARDIENKWKKQHEDIKESKDSQEKAAKKLQKQLKFEQSELEKKKEKLKIKVFELKQVLHRLLQEESQKFNELKQKNEELQRKQKQVDLLRTFYEFEMKNQKDKNEKAKEIVWQTKQKFVRLKSLYNEILDKYKNIHEKMKTQNEKLGDSESVVKKMYYPTVFCPDQTYCKDFRTNENLVDINRPPIVYCPRKDFCTGVEKLAEHDEKWIIKDSQNEERSRVENRRKRTKSENLRLVKPPTHILAKIHPFFAQKQMENETETNQRMKTDSRRLPVKPKLNDPDGKWHFSSTDERVKQRDDPSSWYFHWGEGRQRLRSSDKMQDENWHLKLMKEREQQKEPPVHWYFKRAKQREEYRLDNKNDWIFKRAKSREEARKQEGFYYCW